MNLHADVLQFILGAGTLLGKRWTPGHVAYGKARALAQKQPDQASEAWAACLDELQTLWLQEPVRGAA